MHYDRTLYKAQASSFHTSIVLVNSIVADYNEPCIACPARTELAAMTLLLLLLLLLPILQEAAGQSAPLAASVQRHWQPLPHLWLARGYAGVDSWEGWRGCSWSMVLYLCDWHWKARLTVLCLFKLVS